MCEAALSEVDNNVLMINARTLGSVVAGHSGHSLRATLWVEGNTWL